jgi:hypothetical protein
VKIYYLVGPEPMDISTASTSQTCEIPSSDVMILEGHTSEVGTFAILFAFYINILFFVFSICHPCASFHLLPFRFVPVHGVQQDHFLHQGQ